MKFDDFVYPNGVERLAESVACFFGACIFFVVEMFRRILKHLAVQVAGNFVQPSENQRFCEEKFAVLELKNKILHRFWRFEYDFGKNRALKTHAKKSKSGAQNPKP